MQNFLLKYARASVHLCLFVCNIENLETEVLCDSFWTGCIFLELDDLPQ